MRWLLVAMLMSFFPSTGIAQGHHDIPNTAVHKYIAQKDALPVVTTTKSPVVPPSEDVPLYNPPPRGAPAGRVAGGTRGFNEDPPMLSALAPTNHTGLSVHPQPTLYWYLSKAVPYPIEFTLIDDRTVTPLLEKRLSSSQHPGVQHIRLADYHVSLEPGVTYQWFVTMVVDPGQRHKDVVASGAIALTASPATLPSQLAQAGPARASFVYAQAGLWYDAVMAVSKLINEAPQDQRWRRQRAALLSQVGLGNIAKAELQNYKLN